MFAVNEKRLMQLEARWLDQFVYSLTQHCKQMCPVVANELTHKELDAAVRCSIYTARSQGFSLAGELRFWTEASMAFGSSFYTDPQYAWIFENLNATHGSRERSEEVHTRLVEVMEGVRTPVRESFATALCAIRRMSETSAERALSVALSNRFSNSFPQLQKLQPVYLSHLNSTHCAGEELFPGRTEDWVVCMVFLGCRFAYDPFYAFLWRGLSTNDIEGWRVRLNSWLCRVGVI